MILSKKRIIKALMGLRGCAGRFAPLLFANTEDVHDVISQSDATSTMKQ